MTPHILALDIGGSKIAAGLVDASGQIREYLKWTLPDTYGEAFILETLREKVSGLLHKGIPVTGIGVSVPAVTDAQRGIWVYAPFSGIAHFPIAQALHAIWGIPVWIENDVNACATGEKMFGCCKQTADFLWITISNGIGGGLFLNNRLYYGASGSAGEIGHITVEENNGRVCGCGKHGCLEAEASGFAISAKYNAKYKTQLTTQALAAKHSEQTAVAAFYEAGYYVGKAIAHTLNLLNLEKVVIGGGVAESFHLLSPGLDAAVARYLFTQANPAPVIEKTALGYHAGLLGAAAVAWTRSQNG